MTTNRRTISISPRRHGSALTTECRLRWPATAAAFVVLLGISGCGGGDDGAGAASVDTSDETSAVDAAFVDRAEAVCMPYADYTEEHPLQVPGFNRFAPDPDKLPKIAAYLDSNPAYHTLVSKLESLGDPSTGQSAWTTAVADLGDGQRLVQEEVRSARAGDTDAFVAASQDRVDSTTALHIDMIAAGLSPKSACLAAQDDPLVVHTAMH